MFGQPNYGQWAALGCRSSTILPYLLAIILPAQQPTFDCAKFWQNYGNMLAKLWKSVGKLWWKNSIMEAQIYFYYLDQYAYNQ